MFIINNNLNTIYNRFRGQKFYVENGELKLISTVWQRFRHFIHRKQENSQVKTLISKEISQLDLSKNIDLKGLFFEKLAHLSQEVFDRSAIPENIQRSLIEILRKEREGLDKKDPIKPEFAEKILSVLLANLLGLPLELISGGTSGVYLGKNLKGDKVFVFKPYDEGPYSIDNPKFLSRLKLRVQHILRIGRPSLELQAECYPEVFSYRLAKYFDLSIVPQTVLEELKTSKHSRKKEGSCQEWVEGGREASDEAPSVFGFPHRSYDPEAAKVTVDDREFVKLAALDFLTGNQDRDTDNWKVKEDGTIVAFDNGPSFPYHHPTGFLSTRKQYMWGRLDNAKAKMSLLRDTFLPKLQELSENPYDLNAFYQQIGQGHLTENQKIKLKDRILVLRFAIENDKSAEWLSQIKTKDDFVRFFQEHTKEEKQRDHSPLDSIIFTKS